MDWSNIGTQLGTLSSNPIFNMGLGMMSAAGPSLTPHSFGQDLAQGSMYAMQAQQQAQRAQQQKLANASQAQKVAAVDAYNKWYKQQTAGIGGAQGSSSSVDGQFGTPQQAQAAQQQLQPTGTPTPDAPLLNSANGTPGISFSTPNKKPSPMASVAENPALQMALDPVYHMLSQTNPAAATAYMTNQRPQPVQLARGNQIVDPRTGHVIADNPMPQQVPQQVQMLQALQNDPSLMQTYRQMHPVAPSGGSSSTLLTPQEVSQIGLPSGTVAQRDAHGKISILSKGDNGYNSNTPMPMGDPSVTGYDYFKTIDPKYQPMVKAVLEGRQAPPTGSAARSSYWMGILDAANKVDPTFDTTDYQKRYKTAQDFSPSGSSGQQVKALNTLIQHIGGLQNSYQKLNNSGSPMLNAILNKAAYATGLGGKNLKAYELNAHAAAQEVESLWKKGGGNEADIKTYADKLSSSNDPTTEKQVLSKMLELAGGRLQALHSSYQNAMGNSGVPMQFVNENSLKAMAKINPDLLGEYQHNARAEPSGQLAGPNNPTMPQQQAQPAASPQPRAINPQTGHAVVWNGSAWVPE